MFPKVSEDTLIPYEWCEIAHKRWEELKDSGFITHKPIRLGVDVAGMGRDRSCFIARQGNYVSEIKCHNSGRSVPLKTHWLSKPLFTMKLCASCKNKVHT